MFTQTTKLFAIITLTTFCLTQTGLAAPFKAQNLRKKQFFEAKAVAGGSANNNTVSVTAPLPDAAKTAQATGNLTQVPAKTSIPLGAEDVLTRPSRDQLQTWLDEFAAAADIGHGFNLEHVPELLTNKHGDLVAATLSILQGGARDLRVAPILLDSRIRAAIETVEPEHGWGPKEVLQLYQRTVDKHFTQPLTEIAGGKTPTQEELWMLESTLLIDPIPSVFQTSDVQTSSQMVRERIRIMQKVWPSFSTWWQEYLNTDEVPTDNLWRVYIPFSQFIVREKRRVRPNDLYILGVYGSQGRGKTVLSRAIAVILNVLLEPEEGQAVARSIDDYYKGKAEREPMRALGYDPGLNVSNRGPAGTHDTKWLWNNILEFKTSTPNSVIKCGNFNKSIDDQPQEPYAVSGKVGVFILDGWFNGANTQFNLSDVPEGFKRVVAEALQRDYRPIFERFDALWAFDTPSIQEIETNRQQQEDLLEAREGRRGMSREAITRFVRYFYEDSWDWKHTSPIPQLYDTTFLAAIDSNRHFVQIVRRGRFTPDPTIGASKATPVLTAPTAPAAEETTETKIAVLQKELTELERQVNGYWQEYLSYNPPRTEQEADYLGGMPTHGMKSTLLKYYSTKEKIDDINKQIAELTASAAGAQAAGVVSTHGGLTAPAAPGAEGVTPIAGGAGTPAEIASHRAAQTAPAAGYSLYELAGFAEYIKEHHYFPQKLLPFLSTYERMAESILDTEKNISKAAINLLRMIETEVTPRHPEDERLTYRIMVVGSIGDKFNIEAINSPDGVLMDLEVPENTSRVFILSPNLTKTTDVALLFSRIRGARAVFLVNTEYEYKRLSRLLQAANGSNAVLYMHNDIDKAVEISAKGLAGLLSIVPGDNPITEVTYYYTAGEEPTNNSMKIPAEKGAVTVTSHLVELSQTDNLFADILDYIDPTLRGKLAEERMRRIKMLAQSAINAA